MNYIYKQYTNNIFVGILKNVVSQPQVTSEINTAGSQLIIDLGVSFENSGSNVSYDNMVTETTENIVTEADENISASSSVILDGIPSLNDRIEVWEISDTDQTGRIVFNGLVSKWSANYSNDTTRVTVLSYGVQLDNYLVQILPNEEVAGLNLSLQDSTDTLYKSAYKTAPPNNRIVGVAQTFTVPATMDISSLFIYAQTSGLATYARISLYEGTPSSVGLLLGSVVQLVALPTMTEYELLFPTPISLSISTSYFISVFNDLSDGASSPGSTIETIIVAKSSVGGYANGSRYSYNDSTGWSGASGDLIFSILSPTGAIGNQFLSYDPSNIVKELLDNFIALGGNLTYTDDSIDLSGATVSYTFKFNTYYEALQKCIELAPANWYWYVDTGTGIVYFKPKPVSVSHTLIKGKHINNFEIEQSLEYVTNLVYFTGGATAGVNLQVYNLNTTSIANYGQWLETQADNRVTNPDSANIIIQGILDQKSEPRFIIPDITVLANAYDISTFMVGQCVGFANFNNLVNSLVLQIMSITYTPDSAILKLEVLPPTQSKRLEDIKRNLEAQQTENNPAT